ncbi:MAG: hypothetical protein ABSA47_17105 [Verrucomicrobiota bacterium]
MARFRQTPAVSPAADAKACALALADIWRDPTARQAARQFDWHTALHAKHHSTVATGWKATND